MRIVTDGKRFAVAKGRWFWTQFLDNVNNHWWQSPELHLKYSCFDSLEKAQYRMKDYLEKNTNKKHWDVKE